MNGDPAGNNGNPTEAWPMRCTLGCHQHRFGFALGVRAPQADRDQLADAGVLTMRAISSASLAKASAHDRQHVEPMQGAR